MPVNTHSQPPLNSSGLPSLKRVSPLPKHIAWMLVIVLLAAVFYRASNTPIWHIDTWGHWKYGQWIWEHKRLPVREPFSIYSDPDLPLHDTGWLSQVVCYRVYTVWGIEGIALFFACLEVAKSALYLAAFRRASGSLTLAVLGLALLHAGRWTLFGVFRPQTIGEVCWAALLFISAGRPWPRLGVIAAPLCMALWANLHGGFLLGFVLIGALLLSRAWDVMNGRLRLSACLDDLEVRRLALTLLLTLAAVSLNPYGPHYLLDVIRFGRLPSMQFVSEWAPAIPLATYYSQMFAVSVLLVLATIRWSPRRFTLADTLLLIAFGLGAWFTRRMIPFWMTVWPLILLPHWRALLQRMGWDRFVADESASSGPQQWSKWWQVIPAGACAVLLVLLSATGNWLCGMPWPLQDRLQEETPLAIARDLAESTSANLSQPPGRVFCSDVWSDYLVWQLPAKDQVFDYTHWHCFTPRHLNDGIYLESLHGPPHDWKGILDHYRLNVVALRNKGSMQGLFGYLMDQWGRTDSEWDVIVYTDNVSSGRRERTGDVQPGATWGLLARRRVDPFAFTLTKVQAVQNCLNAGMSPGAGDWSILTHLPWIWPDR